MEYKAYTDADQNELSHYGRLGMKWYEHIYGEEDGRAKYNEKQFSKSMKKLGALDKKTTEMKFKSAKDLAKYQKKEMKAYKARSDRKYNKRMKKAMRFKRAAFKENYKSEKYQRKAKKLVAKMNRDFGDWTPSQFSAEQISLGKQYALAMVEERRNKS